MDGLVAPLICNRSVVPVQAQENWAQSGDPWGLAFF